MAQSNDQEEKKKLYIFSGDRRVCYDDHGSFVCDSPNLFCGSSGSVRTGLTGVRSGPEPRAHERASIGETAVAIFHHGYSRRVAGVIRLCHRYSFYSFNAEKFNSFYSKINEWPHCYTACTSKLNKLRDLLLHFLLIRCFRRRASWSNSNDSLWHCQSCEQNVGLINLQLSTTNHIWFKKKKKYSEHSADDFLTEHCIKGHKINQPSWHKLGNFRPTISELRMQAINQILLRWCPSRFLYSWI